MNIIHYLLILVFLCIIRKIEPINQKQLIEYESFSVLFTKETSTISLIGKNANSENRTDLILGEIKEKVSDEQYINKEDHQVVFNNNINVNEPKKGVYNNLRIYYFNMFLPQEISNHDFKGTIRMFIDESNITLNQRAIVVNLGCLLVNITIVDWKFCKKDCEESDCCFDLKKNKEVGEKIEISLIIKSNKTISNQTHKNNTYYYDSSIVYFSDTYLKEGKIEKVDLQQQKEGYFLISFSTSRNIQYMFFICPHEIKNMLSLISIIWVVIFSSAFCFFFTLIIFRIQQLIKKCRTNISQIVVKPFEYSEISSN